MTRNKFRVVVAVAGLIVVVGAAVGISRSEAEPPGPSQSAPDQSQPQAVTVTDLQAKSLTVESVVEGGFVDQREVAGIIDFNQDRLVQVFSPWQGRIVDVFVKAGDDVKKGAPLFSVDSPDLVQAESSLISAAGVSELNRKILDRARKLFEVQGNAQKDVDQAQSDEQAAEAAYKAARDALRIFGKSDAEMDKLVSSRKLDGHLTIASPIAGRVTARTAAPGLLTQPGSGTAPVTVADLSAKWLVANVPEYLLPRLQLGALVEVSVLAYPGRKFEGKVSNIGASVDPTTHTIPVRSELNDPKHELLPQMLATFVIHTGELMKSVSVPSNGLVREGDGTTTVFVTRDGRTFERRAVKTGLTQNGRQQILEGLSPGEKIATNGALFLSNALALATR
ncbi:MAG: efflux RND transporter periplasmic adaptor subunit [Rhodocyclaceae bacterium]|nr:MAG: efflux RND transporter periplasmic adaptor subunit [Rhodocyclaceae bacterium]